MSSLSQKVTNKTSNDLAIIAKQLGYNKDRLPLQSLEKKILVSNPLFELFR